MHKKTLIKIRKARRNRAKIRGTSVMPRISVFRSNKYLHAQLIDDNAGKTVVSLSTAKLDKKGKVSKIKQAEMLGAEIAKRASEAKIKQAVFDRGSYKYHGRVKAFAESLRANGVKI